METPGDGCSRTFEIYSRNFHRFLQVEIFTRIIIKKKKRTRRDREKNNEENRQRTCPHNKSGNVTNFNRTTIKQIKGGINTIFGSRFPLKPSKRYHAPPRRVNYTSRSINVYTRIYTRIRETFRTLNGRCIYAHVYIYRNHKRVNYSARSNRVRVYILEFHRKFGKRKLNESQNRVSWDRVK